MIRARRIALAASSLVACTDVQLREGDIGEDTIAVSGQFCTPPPTNSVHEIDVLFLVDSSPSLQWNDPNGLIPTALDQVTRAELASGAQNVDVKFGVIRFGLQQSVEEDVDYPSDYPNGVLPNPAPLFTSDDNELQNIWTRMEAPVCQQTTPPLIPANCNPMKYLDGTNYVLGLTLAQQYIQADIAAHPTNIATSQYIIEFVTDGMPQALSNNPSQTVQDIISLVQGLQTAYDVRTDVILVDGLSVVVPPAFQGLLPNMAVAGAGQYLQLDTPADLQTAFNTALSQDTDRLVEYELANYFVYNRNLILTRYPAPPPSNALSSAGPPVSGAPVLPYVDSDGDGLIDQLEIDNGLNPQAFDSSGDGLSDWFKFNLAGQFDPLAKNVWDRSGTNAQDSDGDGFLDFEETHLGTDPLKADMDRDGVPDDIELLVGTNPGIPDVEGDLDRDGVPNGAETNQHTDPVAEEDGGVRAAYEYVSAPAAAPDTYSNGVRCYSFNVQNIHLAPTLSNTDRQGNPRPAGMNQIEVVVVAKPVADPNNPALAGTNIDLIPNQHLRARPWVIYEGKGKRDPEAMEINVQPSDFSPISGYGR
jgi:hypothetical protein